MPHQVVSLAAIKTTAVITVGTSGVVALTFGGIISKMLEPIVITALGNISCVPVREIVLFHHTEE